MYSWPRRRHALRYAPSLKPYHHVERYYNHTRSASCHLKHPSHHSHIREQLPKNREQETLQTIREQSSRKTTSEQSRDSFLADDLLGGFHYNRSRSDDAPRYDYYFLRTVSDIALVHLSVRLDHTQTVRDRVRDDGRRESDKGLSLLKRLELWALGEMRQRTNNF